MDHRDRAIANNKLIEMWVVEELLGETRITHGVHPTEEEANAWCQKQRFLTPDIERLFTVLPRVRDGFKIARTPEEVAEALSGLDRAIQVQKLEAEMERLLKDNPNLTDAELGEKLQPLVEQLQREFDNETPGQDEAVPPLPASGS